MFTQWLSNKSRILIKDFILIILCAFKELFEWIINKEEQFILYVSKLHFISHRSSQRRSSLKKGVLKKIRNMHRKAPVLESLFSKPSRLINCLQNGVRNFLDFLSIKFY